MTLRELRIACDLCQMIIAFIMLVFALSFGGGIYDIINNTAIQLPYFGVESATQLTLISIFSIVTVFVFVPFATDVGCAKASKEVHLIDTEDCKNHTTMKDMDNMLKLVEENQKRFGYHSLAEMQQYQNKQLKEVNQELKH